MDEIILRDSPSALVSSSVNPEELLSAFLSGRKATTLRAYERDLRDFQTFLKAETTTQAAELLLSFGHGKANALALGYRSHLIERGLSPSTVNRRLSALRSVVKLARTLGMVHWALDVDSIKSQPYRDTSGPGSKAVRQMMDGLDEKTGPKASRDRALLRLLYDLGLRRNEVVSLDLEHLDLEERKVLVLGKGKNEREPITLPSQTAEALQSWLDARGDAPGPLFVNFDRAGKGKRLSGTSLYRIVRALGAAKGVTARPHGLRHTAITEALIKTNGDVRAARCFSRHALLQTLVTYDDNREDLAGDVAALVASTV